MSQKHGLARAVKSLAAVGFLVAPFAAATAHSPCDFVTKNEASSLLGVPVTKSVPQAVKSATPGCLIESAEGASIRVSVETIAPEDAPRLLQHVDDERGDEKPSMHGDSWYEISVVDSKHPDYRRLTIHRDRTSLILDLHSSHQKNAKAAFEKVWFQLSERLPTDEKE